MELMKKLFTTACYVGIHERPYTDFEKLNELQAKNYGDEKTAQHYNNDKQARELIHYIAKSEEETALYKIRNSEFIAVAADGFTDSANIEEESYFVSYENYKPVVEFVKMAEVEGRTNAQGLKDNFLKTFDKLEVNPKLKCVHLATDGLSVMRNMCGLVRNEIQWLLKVHHVHHAAV